VYVGLIRPPLRFAIHRRVSPSHEVFELYKPKTLHEFVSQLLTVLSFTRADFMRRVAQLDDEEFQQSRHRTRRYIAEHRDVLYIDSKHLTEAHSEQVLGYWIATNIGRKEVGKIVGLACHAACAGRENISKLRL
jgi:hypothetical protein